ncbi:hypothetical protein [Vibrio coralliilyticus]|uniref:hypothetical protein n=1 Tax=Vibrio coralliilyticus TaxID=190893 RepID=UPI000C1670A8|nr:hypothetical protein [Vibrio coralliilyticus]
MNKSLNKQSGFTGIASLLTTLTILSIGSIYWSKYESNQRLQRKGERFYERIVYLETQFHAYISDRYQAGWGINTASIFPAKFEDLEGQYIPSCSDADNNAGSCSKFNQTPWGLIPEGNYTVVPIPNAAAPEYYQGQLTIDLPAKNNSLQFRDRQAALQMIGRIPNVVFDDAANTITLLINRPDKAFAYDSLVKRSGDDSELLGDWDVGGNHAITNVYDLSIKGQDVSGNSRQISVVRGLDRKTYVKHGDRVTKPVCPSHTTASIWLSIARTKIDSNYTATGSVVPEYVDRGTYWDIYVKQRVKHNSSGVSSINYSAVALAQLSCE